MIPVAARIADAAAHGFPAGMADIDGVDEGIAHQAADQADDTVGGQHTRCRVGIAGRFRAFHIVHGLDEVVDAERDGGDQDHAEILKPGEHVIECRKRYRESEVREGIADAFQAQPTVVKPEEIGAPGDDHPDRDRDETGGNTLGISEAAEPAHHDDREAGQPDHRRHVHCQRRTHGDEGDRYARERPEQRGTRRDAADDRRNEAADHQDEALKENPGQSSFPALDRIVGL